MTSYLLWMNDQQAGPFTMTQLKAMWLNGQITAKTLYWREEINEWCGLGALVENTIAGERVVASPAPAAPQAKGWNAVEYFVLLICTLILPFAGFIVGFIGVFNPAKRQRAATLMGLGMLMMGAYWMLLFR